MHCAQIRLWTWQKAGFEIDSDQVDLTQSWFHNLCHEQHRKYEVVRERLATDQLLWCFTEQRAWKSTEEPRVQWTLSVATEDVGCFVDEWLAERLISKQPCPDIGTWRLWRREALDEHPGRPDRQEKLIADRLGDHSGAAVGFDEAWTGIILDEPEVSEATSAVLRCPIPPTWVIERPEDLKSGARHMYTMEDLEAAKAEQARIEERWANYSGNNPNKYESDRKEARRRVRTIEGALKESGVFPLTEHEALERELDAAFSNAESKQVVEHRGKRYRRRFFPLEKSRSGKSVTEWGKGWEEAAE